MIRKMDKTLLLFSLLLFAFGLIMVFSASNVAAFMKYMSSPYRFVFKQSIALAVALVVSLIIIRFNTKSYNYLAFPLMLTFIVLLAFVLIYGKTTNQATSWIKIQKFTFQPSEFIKVITIIWMASFYDINRKKLDNPIILGIPLVLSGIAALLIYVQPDLGTDIIYALIVGFVFFLVPFSKKIKTKLVIVILLVIAVGCIVLLIGGKSILTEEQRERFDVSKPCSEEKFYTNGNQVCNSYIAVNNGGLFGKGLGNSTQKYLYLPEAHTDFIFAILLEELGLIAGIVVIIIYAIILWRIILIGKRSYNNKNALICYGIAFYIFLHIAVNLCGIFGLIPMTGVPLPFISYGGCFTICLMVSLTIVQRICIENKIIEEKGNK